MKRKVELSSYCWIITALTTAILCGVVIYALNQPDHDWAIITLGIIILGLYLTPLFYMPLSISVDDKYLNINRPLRTKSIPLADIAEAKLCPPTIAARRICGSGGWFGWFGWFSEPDLGKYFAYYGKASDCFLVTLKNGRKYMLGCTDAPAILTHLSPHLSEPPTLFA